MTNVTELIDNSNRLIGERINWERVWDDSARFVLPMQDREWRKGQSGATTDTIEGWAAGPKSTDRYAERYDITGLVALDRLAAGLISLTTPDNEKWQELGISSLIGDYEATDEEARWLERQRDYLLATRYNPLVGWVNANQTAMRSLCAFGTGLYLAEEAYGRRGASDASVPYTFSPLPLSENYLTVDGQGELDGDYRRYSLNARQAATLFGSNLSAKTLAKANDPQKWNERIDLLHYVGYRQQAGMYGDPMRNSLVESCYIEVAEKHEIRRGGFTYWPIIRYIWNHVANSPYGESPVMLALAEIKAANVLAKNTLLSTQQLTRPPVATADDASQGRPNLNPGAINYGMLTADGRLKVAPIVTSQNPSLVKEVLEASRMQIRDAMYTTLWQILIQNPQMTATEALIRANEKAELLGPIGTKIQHGLTKLTEAELIILEGKGAWRPGASLAPPQSLAGKGTRPKFNSPMDRLRRSGELIGIQRTLEVILPIAETKPSIMDRIDEDEVLKIAQEVTGAPKRMLRTDEEVDAIREQRDSQAQVDNAIATTGAAGAAAQAAIPAIQQGGDLMRQIANG